MEEKTMKGHILIVEDEQTHRTLTEKILRDLGLQVTPVDNGFAALDKLDVTPEAFDLIIMDWEMPEMDGLETVRKIRARQIKNSWAHIPVIAFTANKRDGDMEQCLAAGMDDYLSKEIFLPKWRIILLEKLEKWLAFEGDSSETPISKTKTTS